MSGVKNNFAFDRLKEFVALPMEGQMSFDVVPAATQGTLNAMKVRLSGTKAHMRREGMVPAIFLMSIVSVTPIMIDGMEYDRVVLRKRSTIGTAFAQGMRAVEQMPKLLDGKN